MHDGVITADRTHRDAGGHPFHVDNWPKAIVRPEDYAGGTSLNLSWDLGSTTEAEKKAVVRAWVEKLPTLHHLERLKLWSHVTPPVFEAACQLPNLQALQIKWSSIEDLSPIAGLRQLAWLSIGSSTKVKSIEPLARLRSLRWLEIENFKSVSDFSPLVALSSLRHLAVTGSMWSRQAIGDLGPFAAMTWLTSLAIDTSSVTTLRPLERLTGLRELGLGGRLPFEEYAWLSARLPDTECRWFAPYFELAGSGYSRCRSCAEDSMAMMTGKGKPTLCLHCDAERVGKHVAAFEAARSAR